MTYEELGVKHARDHLEHLPRRSFDSDEHYQSYMEGYESAVPKPNRWACLTDFSRVYDSPSPPGVDPESLYPVPPVAMSGWLCNLSPLIYSAPKASEMLNDV